MKTPVAIRLTAGLLLLNAANAEVLPCLPDTGQTNRYTQTFGEDSDFRGRGPSYADNGDGTVTDRITGLVWQKTDGGEMTWEQAREYAHKLQLGGHADWRLPASMELFSVVDHSANGPAMNTAVFTRTEAKYWWTDSVRCDDTDRVWVVNSGGGIGPHLKQLATSPDKKGAFHVRCVRGDSPLCAGPSLNDNGDGTVTDQTTGLIWQKIGPDSDLTWEEALTYCSWLRLAGQSDWRLPNIKELRSLSDDRNVKPSVDKTFFPAVQAAYYWSSTSQCNRPESAWFADFTTGLVSHTEKQQKHLVLAVRGGAAVPGPAVKPAPDPTALPGGRGEKRDAPQKERRP
ncbi:MAG TPA: DUF1566 domain-containing protein [Pontiellaceae bacterium]|nr:DUF1566 domain-containing protein [Pontiellaceae bacterium]